MAYIADITDEKNRSKGMGMVGAAFGLGFILGPLIGAVFSIVGRRLGSEPPLGESFPALIASAICLVNFLFALKALPESRKFGTETTVRGLRFQRIGRALGTPILSVLMLLVFINTFAMAHVEAPLFLYMHDRFQWSQTSASFGFGYIGLIMVFTQGYLVRKLMPKKGERNLLIVGLLLTALGLALISVSHSLAMMALAVTSLGLGSGLANPSLNGSVSLVSGRDEQGMNLGVSQSLSSLARILGPPSGGALYQHVGVWSPFAAAGLLSLCAMALAWAIHSNLPEGGKASAE